MELFYLLLRWAIARLLAAEMLLTLFVQHQHRKRENPRKRDRSRLKHICLVVFCAEAVERLLLQGGFTCHTQMMNIIYLMSGCGKMAVFDALGWEREERKVVDRDWLYSELKKVQLWLLNMSSLSFNSIRLHYSQPFAHLSDRNRWETQTVTILSIYFLIVSYMLSLCKLTEYLWLLFHSSNRRVVPQRLPETAPHPHLLRGDGELHTGTVNHLSLPLATTHQKAIESGPDACGTHPLLGLFHRG